MDKEGKLRWMLGGWWVQGFQNVGEEETVRRKMGWRRAVGSVFFPATHRGVVKGASETGRGCAGMA